MDAVRTAANYNSQETVRFLLSELKRPDTLHPLTENDCIDSTEYKSSSHLGGMVCQEDVDDATRLGLLPILKWYSFFDPEMPQPSAKALKKGCELNNFELFEWVLERYYQKCLYSFKSNWLLSQKGVDGAAMQGCVSVLEWNECVNRKTWQPTVAALDVACGSGHSKVIMWLMNKVRRKSVAVIIQLLLVLQCFTSIYK
ncbi:hypothetical protein PSACC_00042 [Paramicrosporidium saccamoebae]|uniref:Uncharacterized protein n=1 Tax=Paramicrosporidium saccamoebae TaxID=1246581 RepID=A0A2H9TQW9_9FUNG|nr:hypothetical protein PSACC_00042 [Paramicrosporidium saccamoebae]